MNENTMSSTALKTLINGGLITITLGTLYVLFKLMTNDFAHVETVISKNNDALIQQAVSNEKLVQSVDKLGNLIDRKLK